MTVKNRLRLKIFYKTVILLVVAAILGGLCYYASSHDGMPDYNNAHLTYTLASAGLSLAIVAFVAWKIRFFHDIFTPELNGTIISLKRETVRSFRANMNMDDLVMIIQPDGKKRKKKLRLPYGKVGRVYCIGDRVHRLKGTRYPINLTREAAQHICPICGRDSCYEDECPDCGVKY